MSNAISIRLTKRNIEIALQAIAYIEHHYHEQITQESLSFSYNIQVRTLQAAFKKLVNVSIHKYLEQTRLKAAISMLMNDDYSIKEIFNKVGYSSQSHFGEFFKKHTGITPAQYRIRKTA